MLVVVVVADKLKVFPVCLLNEKVKSAVHREEGKMARGIGGAVAANDVRRDDDAASTKIAFN